MDNPVPADRPGQGATGLQAISPLTISPADGQPDSGRPLAQIQADRERLAVNEALSACQGNVTRAARQLGISRQLLHYKIRKHRLCRADYLPRN